MNKTKRIEIRLSQKEFDDFNDKVSKTSFTRAKYLRLLMNGFIPPEKPSEDFYIAFKELTGIGNRMNQLAAKANSLGFIDAPMLKEEAVKWAKFQTKMMDFFLSPRPVEIVDLFKLEEDNE